MECHLPVGFHIIMYALEYYVRSLRKNYFWTGASFLCDAFQVITTEFRLGWRLSSSEYAINMFELIGNVCNA